jgi:hypothetical protein
MAVYLIGEIGMERKRRGADILEVARFFSVFDSGTKDADAGGRKQFVKNSPRGSCPLI